MFITGMSRWAMSRDELKKYPNPFKLGDIPLDSRVRIKEELSKVIVQSVKTLGDIPYDDNPYNRSINHARMFLKTSGLKLPQAQALLKAHFEESKLSRTRGVRTKQIRKRRAQLRALQLIME